MARRPSLVCLLFAGMVLTVSVEPLLAQAPRPQLRSVFPAGGRRSESTTLVVEGSDLEGPLSLWFDDPALKAEPVEGKPGTFLVTVGPDATVGHHDVRVLSPLGLSNARAFVVGPFPEVRESDPNDTPGQAAEVPIPCAIEGQTNPATDRDFFAFPGRAGQRVRIELEAYRIDSRLDGRLILHGPDGRIVAECEDAFGLDPILDVKFPQDGRYVVEVTDVVYAGSPDHVYRLTIEEGPHIDAIQPLAARPGSEGVFRLLGRGLGGTELAELRIDGSPVEERPAPIRLPGEGLQARPSRFVPSFAAAIPGIEFRLDEKDGIVSNPAFIAAAVDPIVTEVEPNGLAPEAQALTLPCDVSGSLDRPGDRDRFRITGKKGEVWRIELYGERIGSPADLVVVVEQLVEGGAVKELVTGDDQPEPAPNFPASLSTTDPALRWEVPADGDYQIVVSDLHGTQRGDIRFGYRMNVRPERPGFELFVQPEGPAPAGWEVPAGGRSLALALVRRVDGYAGPIEVRPKTVPPGLEIEPVVIGPGQFLAPIVVSALPDAPRGVAELAFRGAVPGQETGAPAIPLELVWPTGEDRNAAYRQVRACRGRPVAVIGPGAFRVTVTPAQAEGRPESDVELTVKVERGEGFAEAVELEAAYLPANAKADKVTVAKDQTEAILKVRIPKNAAPGPFTLLVQGSGPYAPAAGAGAEKKKPVTVRLPSNPVRLTIVP